MTAANGPDERRLRLRECELASRSFKDETIVLDLTGSRYLSTNAVGSLLWRRLEAGATREELITAVVEEFEVEREQAAGDIDAFLEECRQRRLLAESAGA